MHILKFKLIGKGSAGMIISANEYMRSSSNNYVLVDKVTRERPVIVPDYVLKEIENLKYFYLNLTGHWHPSYNPYYDRLSASVLPVTPDAADDHLLLKDLWRKTFITGAHAESGYFIITGKMETVADKVIGISTPKITMDDDIGFYDECMTVLDNIAKSIADYFKKGVIALDDYKGKMPAKSIDGKSGDEIAEMVINNLQEKGAIIMMDGNPKELDGGEMVDDVRISGSIDRNNLPEVNEENEDYEVEGFDQSEESEENDDIADPEFGPDKVDTFGPPAAKTPLDPGVGPESGDISQYEHSENMGMPEEGGDDW